MEIKGRYSKAYITIDDVEEKCLNQIYNMVNHPAINNYVAIMPDTHSGKGSVVGFTMPLGDKIIPNIVGVDIGCGMTTIKFEFIGDKYIKNGVMDRKSVDHEIKRSIPTGSNTHNETKVTKEEWVEFFKVTNDIIGLLINKLNKKFNTNYKPINVDMDYFDKKCKLIGLKDNRAKLSIGTLGGGNHFTEVGLGSNDGCFYLTIHSGSRKFGEMVCRYHQNIAKEYRENIYKTEYSKGVDKIKEGVKDVKEIEIKIKDLKKSLGMDIEIDIKGMEFLEGDKMFDYLIDMVLAQQYALLNRTTMLKIINKNLNLKQLDRIETIHNYIDFDDLIIRKGAIKSYEDVLSVIPFNMEDGLLIVKGKSNPEWNYSAPHGAGRLFSRTYAKQVITLEEMKEGMAKQDVYSTSLTKNTIDEAKGAYKDPKMIEEAIKPTAIIIERVKPLINIKDVDSISDKIKK